MTYILRLRWLTRLRGALTVPLSFRICECVVPLPYFDSRTPDACNVSLVLGCVFIDLLTHHRLMVVFVVSVFCFGCLILL